MSHFTCLVVGADYEAALQPFHEFECTGTNDQYVQDIDTTDEKRAEYEADTDTTVVDPAGESHYMFTAAGDFDVRFCAPGEFGRKEKRIPEGWTEGERPTKDRFTFSEWLANESTPLLDPKIGAGEDHKFGYYTVNAAGEVDKVVRRTNPNKKWDWWQIGGRWSNKLLFKDGRRGDAGLVGDIDWDGMLLEQASKAAAVFDRITVAIAGRPVESWEQVRARRETEGKDWDWARTVYNDQQVIKDLVASEAIDKWDGAEQLSGVLAAADRQSYIDREAIVNTSFWSMLHNGQWHERGRMGWWATSDATDASINDYSTSFWATIRGLPADETVTVVDCHI